jgi:hypothetical protein
VTGMGSKGGPRGTGIDSLVAFRCPARSGHFADGEDSIFPTRNCYEPCLVIPGGAAAGSARAGPCVVG